VYPTSHADAVSELPQDAVWLASSNMYPFQAFRLGSALAVQFHPEADAALVEHWLADADAEDRDAALASLAEAQERTETNGAELARAFVAQVLVPRTESALV
jgi:GMP synthase (glutamine-hydrolysing)